MKTKALYIAIGYISSLLFISVIEELNKRTVEKRLYIPDAY